MEWVIFLSTALTHPFTNPSLPWVWISQTFKRITKIRKVNVLVGNTFRWHLWDLAHIKLRYKCIWIACWSAGWQGDAWNWIVKLFGKFPRIYNLGDRQRGKQGNAFLVFGDICDFVCEIKKCRLLIKIFRFPNNNNNNYIYLFII